MDELLAINRKAVFDKLDKVGKVADNYVASDLISALSSNKERDMQIINKYDKDEIFTQKTIRANMMRIVRLFTPKGIARYLQEGKVYSYVNACEYFKIKPIDLEEKKYVNELSDICSSESSKSIKGSKSNEHKSSNITYNTKPNMKHLTYNTKKLLKWLFEKRIQAKVLGDETTILDLVKWINDTDKDLSSINKKKLKLLNIKVDVEDAADTYNVETVEVESYNVETVEVEIGS